METKKSDLVFLNFVINASSIKENYFKKDAKEKILKNFPIDMKLYILNNKVKKDNFKIVLLVSGNNGKIKIPGYSFSVMGSGIFEINNFEKMEKAEVDNFLNWSAVPMVVNCIRGYLINITSYGSFGKYILPSIDLVDLIRKYTSKKRIKK